MGSSRSIVLYGRGWFLLLVLRLGIGISRMRRSISLVGLSLDVYCCAIRNQFDFPAQRLANICSLCLTIKSYYVLDEYIQSINTLVRLVDEARPKLRRTKGPAISHDGSGVTSNSISLIVVTTYKSKMLQKLRKEFQEHHNEPDKLFEEFRREVEPESDAAPIWRRKGYSDW